MIIKFLATIVIMYLITLIIMFINEWIHYGDIDCAIDWDVFKNLYFFLAVELCSLIVLAVSYWIVNLIQCGGWC